MLELYTPNGSMADHLVGAPDELHESVAGQSFMFCFVDASPEKSSFVVDLICLFPSPRVFALLNATRRK